ncbi:SDR family oxidoreductase [Acidipila sp. EB88]|uniref:SDR family oxidoreductase n=1 Tax=Acidipila sp. EB88 TaxID=2305226 RepID=UPI000F5E117A|nr:SDR family oxidoreductase [Acidipila sp. EB88]RRA47285.1 SDR family oxidoreductase [Acidipila sp. EB88]
MANTQSMASQFAVVTGAARGIGEAISHRLAAMGADVLLVARDRTRLEAVQAAIVAKGGSALVHPLDLRDPAAAEALAQTVRDRSGRCDVLVNNAGVGRIGKPLHEMTPDEWDETMDTNLRGPFLMIRALAPLMIERKSGHIINISSLAGRNPLPNGAAYSASKWGLNGLTYSVAEELRPHGIRVSVVAPGSVNTGFGGGDAGEDERAKRKIQPGDVADVVEMLVRQEQQSFVSEVLMRPTSKS